MHHDFTAAASNDNGSIIGESGFAAILRKEEFDARVAGILGAPRVDPTRSGLRIEDSYGAAIDAITIAILEDFARREKITNRSDPMTRAESGCRDRPRPRELCPA